MKKTSIILLILAFALTPTGVSAQIYKSYEGLIMAGYQGWFHAPEPSDPSWMGFATKPGKTPKDGEARFDLWPYTAEFEKTYPTDYKFPDGTTAEFFSSTDPGTIDTHFRWMQEYGLDGVFMQRFIASSEQMLTHTQRVFGLSLEAAKKYGRAICLMYDLTGAIHGEILTKLADDLKRHEETYHLSDPEVCPTYLHHNGKPLVVIWGIGFPDKMGDGKSSRLYTYEDTDAIIDCVKSMGYSVMLGVPAYWRNFDGWDIVPKVASIQRDPVPYIRSHQDSISKVRSALHSQIAKADIIMPWYVGRYNNERYNHEFKQMVRDDIDWCSKHGILYAADAFPGYSWENSTHYGDAIDRQHGEFYWNQLSFLVSAGAKAIYISMFDEINEGTAIFKLTTEAPDGEKSKFVTVEEPDKYLRLTGEAARMLRGETPLTFTMPAPTDK